MTVPVSVYVRDEDGNTLSKAALVDEQVVALRSTSDSEVQRLVESTLSEAS